MTVPFLIDTQLLVLLAVGATSTRIIAKHKNLTEFTQDDFDLLLILIGTHPALILAPNTVSEAANLLRYHRDPERSAILDTFANLIVRNKERYIASAIVARRRDYRRLGVTDGVILELCASSDCELLTADAELYVAAETQGMRAVNFNHKREEFGLL